MTIEGATLVVAANDAKDPLRADYQCDGTDDQVEIQQALDALPTSGGKVILSGGNFNLSGPIRIERDGTTLEGNGTGQRGGATQTAIGTKINVSGGDFTEGIIVEHATFSIDKPVYGVTLRDFLLDYTREAGAGPSGILFRSNRGLIDHVHVQRFPGDGIHLLGYSPAEHPLNGFNT